MSFRFPRQFGERLGLAVRGLDGLNENRAQYSGFFLASALVNGLGLCACCHVSKLHRRRRRIWRPHRGVNRELRH